MRRRGLLLLTSLALLGGHCDPPPPGNDYPIVLAHGLFGTDTFELGGIEILDYWLGVADAMRDEGAEVYVTTTSPIHSSYFRGAQLVDQIETIVALSGQPKVHIVGHSQGGLDARYAAGVRPDRVRSVTTVATPNHGAELARFVSDHIDEQGNVQSPVLNLLGPLLEDFARLVTGSSDPLDWRAAFGFLGDLDQFNSDFPNGLGTDCGDGAHAAGGVRFYSWTGNIVGFLGVRVSTHVLDPSDPLLNTASLFYGLFEPNDGLVTVCSSAFGEVLGDDYLMNHLDTVNQIVGLVAPLETHPLTLYRQHAARLLNLER